MIDVERYRRIDEIFQVALELDPGERPSYISQVCGGDESLVKEVEYLLTSDAHQWELMGTRAFEMVAPLLASDRPELKTGDPIGHYNIASLLGVGGMGHVYLAEDANLGRKVALKLLPSSYTRDPTRLRRFQQEARAASLLNHPNILTIHEMGEVNGQQFIATEFVEGETLRERMKRARLSLTETVKIATQVASALAAAHRAGIVHRDVKPENIMLRPDGYVKVLDFGLAKLTEQYEPAVQTVTAERVDVSSGLVMGTVKYMSPEQARGLSVDARSDIFSVGVALYEMLSGHAPFTCETSSDLITAILKREPPPLTNVPNEMRRIVNRALRKKKEERYQTIQELLVDLKNLKEDKAASIGGVQMASATTAGTGLSTSETAAVSTASTFEYVVSGIKRNKHTAVFVLASLAIVALGTMFGLSRLGGRLRPSSKQLRIERIPETGKALGVAVSPDGQYIAYHTDNASLWVRQLATNSSLQIVPPGKVTYYGLTYSRDGEDIFYVSNRKLYRIPARGGEATKLLDDMDGPISFAPDGKEFAFIRHGDRDEESALLVANVDGTGEHVLVSRKKPDSLASSPAWSPDGSLIACASGSVTPGTSVFAIRVATGVEERITNYKWGSVRRLAWLSDGSGLIVSAIETGGSRQIWHIPYPAGEPRKLTNDLYDYGDLSLTADGNSLVTASLAYQSALWIVPKGDPAGARPITTGEREDYQFVSFTPNGGIVYLANTSGERDIWIMNADGTNRKQLTANAGVNLQPAVSPDGRYIVFSSSRGASGAYHIWRINTDGSNPVQVTQGDGEVRPVCSPDGLWVVYSKGGPDTSIVTKTVWKVPIDGGEPVQLTSTPSIGAAVSPDGTLVACWYQRDQTSPWQIALIPFAGGPPVKTFDTERTTLHRLIWTPDGQGISYIKTRDGVSNIWSQPISGGPPKPLTQFTSEEIRGFDWSRDGQLLCSREHHAQDVVRITDFR